jgi:PAS domain S-box-containing protein
MKKNNMNIFKTIVEFSYDWLMWIDNEHKIKYISPSVKDITGYSPEEFKENHNLFFNIIHPDDRNCILEKFEEELLNPQLCYAEYRLIHKNGNIIWISHRCKPVYDSKGMLGGFVSNNKDITDLKNAFEKLEENEKKHKETIKFFRLMMDNIPELVWAKDIKGRFLFVNKTDAEFLGAKDTEEPIGKGDMFFANRSKQERPNIKDWHTFGEICVNSDEIVLKNKKSGRFDEFGNVRGKFLYLDVIKAPIFDDNGNLIGTVGFGRDVTKQKEMERKLKESEEKYRRIFEESQDVIFVSTKEGKVIDINPAGLKFFGYKNVEEIKEKDISTDIYKNPEDRLFFINKIKTEGNVKDLEIVFKKKDGSEVIGLISATPIFDEKKNICGFRGTIRDITDQKALEAQLFQAQKMESLGRLAGGIAHDFNNILTVINGYAEMAMDKITTEHPLYKDISYIFNAGKRAQKLINQLLAFSRKQVFKPEIIDINKIILSLDKMLKRLIGEDIKIEYFLSNDLPNIKADSSQIEQIFINLIVNAKDALNAVKKPNFEKKITIESGYKYVDNYYVLKHPGTKEGNYLFFSVGDNGVGMDEETKSKIFEPFYTTKEKDKGTGLGLATIYGIVKQNSGFIYVYSEPDEGTTFKIYWPVTDKETDTIERIYDSSLSEGKETILVVEDEDDVREFAVDALMALGYNVYAAENGRKALNMIKEKQLEPELILTDLIMPELNGVEFIEKAKEILPDTKVVFTSGYTDKHIAHNGTFIEGENFIQKPYTLSTLANLIKKVLIS